MSLHELPLISIVTPCLNAEEFIECAICSILDQDYPNLQFIIIDGGSTDRTVDIIRKYDAHIDFWTSEPDEGQADAITKGLSLSRGVVFNWLNADDVYLPGALKTVGHAFNDPNCDVLAGRSQIIGLGSNQISPGTNIYPSIEKTIGCARIDQPETFFRLARVQELNGIDRTFNYLMDKELWIRYLLRFGLHRVQVIDTLLAVFRLHSNSKTVSAQAGFHSDQNRIEKALFNPESDPQDCQMLKAELHDASYMINMSLVKLEYALLQYKMAYAIRDWKRMDTWKQIIYQNPFPLIIQSSSSLIHLEARKSILQLSQLLTNH
jgi:glycosyltransferase involved in cell wall biosynthesis